MVADSMNRIVVSPQQLRTLFSKGATCLFKGRIHKFSHHIIERIICSDSTCNYSEMLRKSTSLRIGVTDLLTIMLSSE